MTPTTELSRADEAVKEPDLDMGEKLLAERLEQSANCLAGKPHTLMSSINRFEVWAVTNLPALLATARRVAEMEGEAHRREAVIAGLRAQIEADCEGGHPHD